MTVTVYQIQYADHVEGGFDPAFTRYDCRQNPEKEKREIAHMLRFFREGIWKESGNRYLGLLSPRFGERSRLKGKDLIDWINSNPGYDVYFVNPYPQLQYLHFNIWEQGEYCHPGLIGLADSLFRLAGYDIRAGDLPRDTDKTLLYCNYWVGNERFWGRFMEFVGKLADTIDAMNEEEKRAYFSQVSYLHSWESCYPFIFERMFTTFLHHDREIRSLSFPWSMEERLSRCDNYFERQIIRDWADMMDRWDERGQDGDEVRKSFLNLQNLQRMYLELMYSQR